jgi:hypothetical protein
MGNSVGVWSCVALVVLVGACAEDPQSEEELDAWRSPGLPCSFEAQYLACDEFAGVGLVPLENVIDRVPDDYVVIEAVPGFAIIVAQAASCDEISVDGGHAKPGVFAQLGVGVVPPLDPGAGDFYQLLFTTDHPQLAYKLHMYGVNARYTPLLSYEITAAPALAVDVPFPPGLSFELNGPITLPDPLAPANPTTVFNYYAQSQIHGNVLQQNVVEGIRFGEGSGVTLTAIGSELQEIVGDDTLVFPFFSSPETFDQADVLVETDVF